MNLRVNSKRIYPDENYYYDDDDRDCTRNEETMIRHHLIPNTEQCKDFVETEQPKLNLRNVVVKREIVDCLAWPISPMTKNPFEFHH